MFTPSLRASDAPVRYTASYPAEQIPPSGPSNAGEESLKSLLMVLRKRIWWIGGVALAGLGLAALVCIFLPRQYTGIATIQVGKGQVTDFSVGSGAASAGHPDDLKTQMATPLGILQNDSIALAVVNDLRLQNYRPFIVRPTLIGWLDGSNARIAAERGRTLDEAPVTRERILKAFAKKLEVRNIPDTRLITVSFMNPDPKLAADIANDLVTQYIRFEARAPSTSQASIALTSQLNELKDKVESSQTRLAAYEKETGLNTMLLSSLGQVGSAGGATHIPALDKLDTLNQALTAAESNRVAKEAIYHLTQTENPEVVVGLGSSSLPGVAGSAVVAQGSGLEALQNLRQQQATLRLAYADQVTKYGAKNPRLVQIGSQLSDLNLQISEELQRINKRAKNEYVLARQNEDAIRGSYNAQQATAGKLNESAVQLQVLAQEATASRQLYDGLYGKLQEANVQAGLRATNIGVADPARPGATPTRPQPPLYLVIGLATGLLFGVSSAFVLEHMDDTVKTPLQLGSSVHLPVLASIPQYHQPAQLASSGDTFDVEKTSESSLLITRPKSSIAEAYRALRTAILFSSANRPLHTLLVTSPLVGDGKTSVAYNVAIAFAYTGRQVCLVDADMRNPHLHHLFGVEKLPGLTDILESDHPVDQVMHQHASISNLTLLPAGSTSPMSAELLGSRKFEDLLHALKQKYDLVILDSPPALLVTDASVISGKVDATLAVIRAGVTTATVIGRVSEILERNGSRAVGFVLNGVDTRSIDYYQAYGHNGVGKYYEESDV